MATKLYPPLIDGTIPAFYLNYDSTSSFLKSTSINIPFTMNNAVSDLQVKGFSLRMRTVGSGKYIFEPIYSSAYNLAAGQESATFVLTPDQCKKLTEGQYYKVQIAYCGKRVVNEMGIASGEDIGYYSTVGIIKCTSKPKLSIKGLSEDSINFFNNEFFGIYDLSNCKDQTERVYSYEFVVYDEQDNVYYTTGEKLHQTYQDTDFSSSIDRVSLNDFASNGITYSISYKVTTLNGMELQTPKYKITSEYLVSPNREITILPESNVEEGYINVKFKGALDKERSMYYVLNEAAFDSVERDERGLILTDGGFFDCVEYVKDVVVNLPDRLSYLSLHSLYRFWSNGLLKTKTYYYKFNLNKPVRLTLWQGYYYDTEVYEYIMDQYNRGLINDEELENQRVNTPCYERILQGFNTIKQFSFQDVEENFIDIDSYFILKIEEHEEPYYGSFLLTRASDEDNYSVWYNLARFKWDNEIVSKDSFQDYTAEHGRRYKYALQQYNIWGLYSARMVSDIYMGIFEDAYLYDGKKTLRIKYNPEVSSFKTTVLEQKTDTLGGKYPFITRNGSTYYKEFPIGGLLAAEIDEKHMFVDPEYGEAHRHASSDPGTDVHNAYRNYHFFEDENIALEKDFKIRVLDWLNNGKPKLFKSPYEGNYIVRLMNNSLSPVKELGRMLHSFTSQAYEIADYSYENLISYGFLTINMPSDYVGLWRSYNLADYDTNGDIIIDLEKGIQSFTVQDMMPGDKLYLTVLGHDEVEMPIMIGITGSYSYANIDQRVCRIRIPQRKNFIDPTKNGTKLTGIISCCYEGIRITAFDSIVNMQLKTILGQQYVGISPFASALRNPVKWQSKINDGIFSFGLQEEEYNEFQNYNIRDYLDDVIQKTRTSEGVRSKVVYKISDNFIKLISSFDPGELLERINLTLNCGEVYKVKLVNIEMLRFSQRPVIPVYAQEYYSTSSQSKYLIGQYETPLKEMSHNNKSAYLVSTTPYGHPYPIEDLREIEMLDPFCIFKVMRLYKDTPTLGSNDATWVPINGEDSSYYDPYYRTWLLEKYDPVAKVNYTWKRVAILDKQYNSETGTYEYTQEAQALADDNAKFWEYQKKKDAGQYYPEKIQEDRMYDYELFIGDHDKFFYKPFNNHILRTIEDPYYDIFNKENDQHYIVATTNILHNKVYWIKEYETEINLSTEKSTVEFKELKNINSIHIGNGVLAEMNFQIRVIDYYTEISDEEVAEAKEQYLEAKNFYNTLMELYNIILSADGDRKRYAALSNLYGKLLYGKSPSTNLSPNDINIINSLLSIPLEKEKLKLMTFYSLERINSTLDETLIDQLLEFKEKPKNADKPRYNFQYAKLYDLYEKDGTYFTSVFDMNNEYVMIFNSSTTGITTTTTKVARNAEGNIVWKDSYKDKVMYRFVDATSGITYYYLVDRDTLFKDYKLTHSSDNILEDDLTIQYIVPKYNDGILVSGTDKIQVVTKTDFQLSNGGSTIDEYLYNKKLDITTTTLNLLDVDELAQVKIDPYFINITEYTSNMSLWENQEILTILNTDSTFRGVEEKYKALGTEIDSFEEQITDYTNTLKLDTSRYVNAYNSMNKAINDFNKLVFQQWTSKVISALVGTTTGKIPLDQLYVIFSQIDDGQNNNSLLSQPELDANERYYAGVSLYNNATTYLPKIQAYNRMIQDTDVNDELLDEHLNEQIKLQKYYLILCFLAMRECCTYLHTAITTVFEAAGSQTTEDNKEQFRYHFYELANKYNLLYTELISNNKIKSDYLNISDINNALQKSVFTEYNRLINLEISKIDADPTMKPWDVISIENLAKASILYDDYNYFKNHYRSSYSAVSLTSEDGTVYTIKGFNNSSYSGLSNQLTTSPLTNSRFQVSQFPPTARSSFDSYINHGVYFYRTILSSSTDAVSEYSIVNTIPYYIFNPTWDNHSPNAMINNKSFAEITRELKNSDPKGFSQMVSVYKQLMTIGIELIEEYYDGGGSVSDVDAQRAFFNSKISDIENQFMEDGALKRQVIIDTYVSAFRQLILEAESYLVIRNDGAEVPVIRKSNGQPYYMKTNNTFWMPSLNSSTRNILHADAYNWETKVNGVSKNGTLYIDPDELKACTDVIKNDITAEEEYSLECIDTEHPEKNGIYYQYIQIMLQKEIDRLTALLGEAVILHDLYKKQWDNYSYKYDQYFALFEDNQNTYESYFGTEAFNYYREVNDPNNPISTTKKGEILKNYRNNVRIAWWNFLNLLDAKYSDEKKKGKYK